MAGRGPSAAIGRDRSGHGLPRRECRKKEGVSLRAGSAPGAPIGPMSPCPAGARRIPESSVRRKERRAAVSRGTLSRLQRTSAQPAARFRPAQNNSAANQSVALRAPSPRFSPTSFQFRPGVAPVALRMARWWPAFVARGQVIDLCVFRGLEPSLRESCNNPAECSELSRVHTGQGCIPAGRGLLLAAPVAPSAAQNVCPKQNPEGAPPSGRVVLGAARTPFDRRNNIARAGCGHELNALVVFPTALRMAGLYG